MTIKKNNTIKNINDIFEIQKFIKDWTILKYNRSGGTGGTYFVKNNNSNVNAILKINTKNKDKDKIKRFENEIKTLKQIKDLKIEGVVEILDDYLSKKNNDQYPSNLQWYIVSEGKDFFQAIKNKFVTIKDLNDFFHFIIIQAKYLFETLYKLHSNHIAHRDIKPENLIWSEQENKFLYIDFGIAHNDKFKENHITANNNRDRNGLGPKKTMPPEMETIPLLSNPYIADVYSLTKTIYLMLIVCEEDTFCFKGQFNQKVHNYKKIIINKIKNNYDNDLFIDILIEDHFNKILNKNTNDSPENRMSSEETLQELNLILEYFEPFEWSSIKDRSFAYANEHNNTIKTYLINIFNHEIYKIKTNVVNIDYYFLEFIDYLIIFSRIYKNNLIIDHNNKNIFFDEPIESGFLEISLHNDNSKHYFFDSFYKISIKLKSKNNEYLIKYRPPEM